MSGKSCYNCKAEEKAKLFCVLLSRFLLPLAASGPSLLPLKKTMVNGMATKKCLKAFPDYFVKIKQRRHGGPEIQTIYLPLLKQSTVPAEDDAL